MRTVLAISSQVVRGSVGLQVLTPALNALGIEVLTMPTILVSNHPGHRFGAGLAIEPAVHEEMVDALDANGWLGEIDGVISGYLPSAGHVDLVRRVINRLRGQRDIIYLCDPVIGDDPGGLYIDQAAAQAIRDELIGIADILTSNIFELGWLSGTTPRDVPAVRVAAKLIGQGRQVVVTSVAGEDGFIQNVGVDGEFASCAVTQRYEGVPNGTGDLFAAFLLGHSMNGEDFATATAWATAGVRHVVEASLGADELRLVANIREAAAAQQQSVACA